MNPGYIYILQNPSLSETHLKIGRTERDPDERAAEISRGTGVPTPFEVVWWSESVDCHLAESILHHHLDLYRTNTTREFFEIDLDEAIRVAKKAIRQSGGRTGGIAYLLRRLLLGTFHGIVRPLLRLPVQIILLSLLIAWMITKGALSIAWRIVRGIFAVLGALFATSGKKTRKKKKAAAPSRSKEPSGMKWKRNDFYFKEVIGTFLWISLGYLFLYEDGLIRCREFFSSASSWL